VSTCQREVFPTTYTNTAVKPLEMSLEMAHELFIHGNNGSFPKTIFITTSAATNNTQLCETAQRARDLWMRLDLFLFKDLCEDISQKEHLPGSGSLTK